MNLCEFSTALGTPGQGIHAHLGGVAILDVLGTFLLAWASYALSNRGSYLRHCLAWFALGTALHFAFCVPTALTVLLKRIA